MEESTRNIRKQFQQIADSKWPVPSSTLLRKAVVPVSKRKMMFSPDQLSKVAAMIMENSPYVLFCSKSESKDYVEAIYWATNELDKNCEIGKRADTVKNEVFVDGY